MDRRKARTIIYKMVYATRYNTYAEYDDLLTMCLEGQSLDKASNEYISETYNGIIANTPAIIERVTPNLQGYSIDRVYPLDMVAILFAGYELLYTHTPPKVAINEAIQLVKNFSTPKSVKFVNGILSKLYKEINE